MAATWGPVGTCPSETVSLLMSALFLCVCVFTDRPAEPCWYCLRSLDSEYQPETPRQVSTVLTTHIISQRLRWADKWTCARNSFSSLNSYGSKISFLINFTNEFTACVDKEWQKITLAIWKERLASNTHIIPTIRLLKFHSCQNSLTWLVSLAGAAQSLV